MSEALEVNPKNDVESSFVAFFSDAVKVVGLPPSCGQIYGLLFSSREPLALDQLVRRLEISKGSASQGLRLLRQLGAVKEVTVEDDRRTFYRAEDQLRRLVGGFMREQIRPHLYSGLGKASELESQAKALPGAEGEFYQERVHRVSKWLRRGNRLMPLLRRMFRE